MEQCQAQILRLESLSSVALGLMGASSSLFGGENR
jgi:hypothetical protein